MTWGRLLLPLVLFAVTLSSVLMIDGIERDWLPMLLVAVGGAVLAFGVSYAIARRETAR